MKWATTTGDCRVNSQDSRSLCLTTLFCSRCSPTALLSATARALASSLCFPLSPFPGRPPALSMCENRRLHILKGQPWNPWAVGISLFMFLLPDGPGLGSEYLLDVVGQNCNTCLSQKLHSINAKNGYKCFSKIPTSNHAERPRDRHFVKLTWNSQIISLNQDATAGVLDIDWFLIIVPLK